MLSPPAAKERLLQYLSEEYRNSTLLCVESIRRLTGSDSVQKFASATVQNSDSRIDNKQSSLHLRPVADLSLEARTTSNVVFVEERQNLYMDSVTEAEAWTKLLLQLDHDAWPSDLASDLIAWTVDGLEHILDTLHKNSISVDGASSPSPTSKVEVFALYTRVLLSAKVVTMRGWTTKDNMGKEHGARVVGLLEKLLGLGRPGRLHDLLLDRVESILEEIGSSRRRNQDQEEE